MTGRTCTASPTALIITMQMRSRATMVLRRGASNRRYLFGCRVHHAEGAELRYRSLQSIQVGATYHRIARHVKPDTIDIEHMRFRAVFAVPRDEDVARIE